MGTWHLQPIFGSYLLVLALVAGLLALLAVPLFRPLPPRQRWLLLGLRLLVILLVLLTLLRPTHESTSSKRQSATLVLLFDQSRSMQLPHQSGSHSRWQAQRQTLQDAFPLLRELSEDLEIKIYAYDQTLHAVAWSPDGLKLPAEPTGEQTDLGSTLYDAVRREHGKRLAGIILMGDGTQTAFEPEVDVATAGRELSRLGYPLYAVPYGPSADAAQSRDVAVEQLPEKYTVFVKNELRVRGLLRVRGYVNQDLPVELVVTHPDGSQRTLGPTVLRAQRDGEQVPIEMSFTPQDAGQYKLTVRAAEQAGELVAKNNELSAFLTVLDGGLKVLYLEGSHRNEVRFLRRTLNAAPDIQLDFDLFERTGRDRWPVDLDSVWQEDAYDAYILGDLPAAALGAANLQKLAAAVERGRGLLTLGGVYAYGPGDYRDTPLRDVLPIEIGRLERQDFNGPFRKDLHLAGRLQLLPTRPHPVTFLAPGPENVRAWQRLPALRGANKFAGLKQSPSVRVLAESEQGDPLLIASEYGRGRVLTAAFDSTWLWAMRGFTDEHRRYWRQAVLWLVRRDELNQDEVWVKLPQRRFRLGSGLTFTTGVKSPLGVRTDPARFTAQLQTPDKRTVEVPLSATSEDLQGRVPELTQAGDYVLKVTVASETPGQPPATTQADFQVLDEDIELGSPAADPDQLARLAGMTRAEGGKLLVPEQLVSLLQEIKQRPPELEIEVQERWQLAGTTASAWFVFLLLAAALIAEWVLRKRWGLV